MRLWAERAPRPPNPASPSGAPPGPSPARCTRSTPAGRSLLLDCGLFQGRRAESRARNRKFPFRPRDIDAVLLSHAHIDHCGNLPNLVKQGFAGPIYCTPATRALAAVMLGDAAKIHEEDAAYLNRQRDKGEPKIEPLYDGRDVYRTLLRLRAVPYDTPFRVGSGAGSDVRRRRPPARLGDDSPAHRRAERRAQPDVHRRPGPAWAADPARSGPGAAGRPAHQRKHLRRPHARAGRGDGGAARRGGAADGRARRQAADPRLQRRPHADDRLLPASAHERRPAAEPADLRR